MGFSRERTVWVLACVVCVGLYFSGMGRDVWGSDEPRIAAISLEMAHGGDFVVPHLGGVPFVEKPPMYFAVAAASVRVLEEVLGTVPAIRLTSVLWGIGTALCACGIARLLARSARRDAAEGAPEGTTGETPSLLSPTRVGLLALMFLATTPAFIDNAQYVRTDIALAFFTTATVWAFASAYLGDRPLMLPVAGLFLAGAVLSKGVIALMFTGSAWLGMFPLWLLHRRRRGRAASLYVGWHLVCLLLFAVVAGGWMYLLWTRGGQVLFDEWFWRNQLGRFDGTASLGHSAEGQPFYYVVPLILRGLPWTPLVLLWLVGAVRALLKAPRDLGADRIVLLVWLALPIAVLSAASTKRQVYTLPILPTLAVVAACAAARGVPRWCAVFLRVWSVVAVVVLAACAVAPVLEGLAPERVLEAFGGAPIAWSGWNLLAAVALVPAAWAAFARGRTDPVLGAVIATALAIGGAIAVTAPLMDRTESDRARLLAFVEQAPVERRDDVAGFDITERIRGLFYLNLQVPLRRVDSERLLTILAGKDPEFSSVILRGEVEGDRVEGLPVVVLAREDPDDPILNDPFTWVAPASDG